MTVFYSDRAPDGVRESVAAVLSPLCEAVGVGIGLLAARLVPPRISFELQRGTHGRGNTPCVWASLHLRGRRGGEVKAWAEPGWALGALVVLVFDEGHLSPELRGPAEVVVSALLLGGHVGRHR